MGSALLNTTIADPTLAEPAEDQAAGSGSPASSTTQALRQQVAERLAAHRNRRSGSQPSAAPRPESVQTANTRAARIAAAVAERYAHTQSYRAFLAAEAERAVQQARAAAEIAALNAQAVAHAQQQLLDTMHRAALDEAAAQQQAAHQPAAAETTSLQEQAPGAPHLAEMSDDQSKPLARELSLWPELEPPKFRAPDAPPRPHRPRRAEPGPAQATSNLEPRTANPPTLTVRLYEDAATAAHVDLEAARHAAFAGHLNHGEEWNEAEAQALDEEIAFRQAPVFEEPAGPPMPLPANLIEFPRQLIASRKARPRYAEGPLREEAAPAPGDGQLRIFEVDPAHISTQPDDPDASSAATVPQWTSIWLDTPTAAGSPTTPGAPYLEEVWLHGQPLSGERPDGQAAASAQTCSRPNPYPEAASIGRRSLACAINAAILVAGVLAFAGVFVVIAGHWQPGTPLGATLTRTGLPLNLVPGAAAGVTALLYLLYQALFFWLSDATPGMRAARVALCTFTDENPSRTAIRRRILAVLLSAVPLGLGLLWAALDEDRLAWHDRIARMYQRSY